ncbi:hypothetical protein PROFUN_14675, partial [Planoprotostelium fungivorum]
LAHASARMCRTSASCGFRQPNFSCSSRTVTVARICVSLRALYRASQNFSAVVMISSQSRDYRVWDPPGGISKALEPSDRLSEEQKEQMGGEIDEADEDKDWNSIRGRIGKE